MNKENRMVLVNRDDVVVAAKSCISHYALTSEQGLMILAIIYEALGRCSFRGIKTEEPPPQHKIEITNADVPILDTDLSVRALNALKEHEYELFGKDLYKVTLRDVAKKTRKQLMNCRNFGIKSYRELTDLIRKNNIPYNKN